MVVSIEKEKHFTKSNTLHEKTINKLEIRNGREHPTCDQRYLWKPQLTSQAMEKD